MADTEVAPQVAAAETVWEVSERTEDLLNVEEVAAAAPAAEESEAATEEAAAESSEGARS